MANKMIEELLIQVKQKGTGPAIKRIGELKSGLEASTTATEALNAALERTPGVLDRIEARAREASASLSAMRTGFNSRALIDSLNSIQGSMETLLGETVELHQTMIALNNNTMVAFDKLANSLGGDLDRIQDQLIDVGGASKNAAASIDKLSAAGKKHSRGLGNQNRQGRNSVRTFSDIAKVAGPLPLLYAQIAANAFALSEALRLMSEGERLNRLEKVGDIMGAKIGTPISFIAQRMADLTGNTLSYSDALQQASAVAAYGFNPDQIEQLTLAARRASVALGVDMQDALNRVVRGSSKLEIELLDELGITTKLTTAYTKYAEKIGVSVDALTNYQQRAALVDEINRQSVQKFGEIDNLIANGAPWETFSANAASAVQRSLASLSNLTSGVARFFAGVLSESSTDKLGNNVDALMGSLKQAESLDSLVGKAGIITTANASIDKMGKNVDNLRTQLALLRKQSLSFDDSGGRQTLISQANDIEELINSYDKLREAMDRASGGRTVEELARIDSAYKALTASAQGTIPAITTSLTNIKGQATAYVKVRTDMESVVKTFDELKKATNGDKKTVATALLALGFESEAQMKSQLALITDYSHAMEVVQQEATKTAKANYNSNGSSIQNSKNQLVVQQGMLQALRDRQKAEVALGASTTVQLRTEAEIYALLTKIRDTKKDIANTDAANARDRINYAREQALSTSSNGVESTTAQLNANKALLANYLQQRGSLKDLSTNSEALLAIDREILAVRTAIADNKRNLANDTASLSLAKQEVELERQSYMASGDQRKIAALSLSDAETRLTILARQRAYLAANHGQEEDLLAIDRQIYSLKRDIDSKEVDRINHTHDLLAQQKSLEGLGLDNIHTLQRQLELEQNRSAALEGTHGASAALTESLKQQKELTHQIQEAELNRSLSIMNNSLSTLAGYGTGISQLTSGLNSLALSFDQVGNSSMTSMQMVGTGLQAFQGMLSYTSSMALSSIDAQIQAEQKRDGSSAASLAKIKALEEKKIKQQEKAAKQQILISTAVAMMQAAANPWPLPAIPLMATAALAGSLAYSQASNSSANSLSVLNAASDSASLSVGSRSNNVNVASAATRGESQYVSGERGIGTIGNFTARAGTGPGIPNTSILVGEHGPERVTPMTPINVENEDTGGFSKSSGFGIGVLQVTAMDSQSIIDRAADIYEAIRVETTSRGQDLRKLE